MKKNLFLTAVCSCLALLAKAETTDISEIENVIYAENMSCSAGSSFTMSVKMKNTIEVTGFQFDLELPSGITVGQDADDFYMIALSQQRTTSARTNYFDSAKQPDGSVRVMASSTKNYTFSGNDGEVATISINVADDVADGKYPIVFKNIVLSDAAANSYETERIETELTVGPETVVYDEGYSVRMLPFLLSDEMEVSFLVSNETDLTKVEFDVVLPQTLVVNELYYTDFVLAKTKFTTTLSQNNDGTEHVSIARRSSNKIAADDNFAIATLGVVYDEVVADGVYPILIKNVMLTDVNGDEFSAAPFTAYMIVGQYERETASEWGTICLPYATQSDENVQIYTLSEVNPTMSEMTFAPVANLAANTPAVFKRLGAKVVFPVAEPAEAEAFTCETSTGIAGWNMFATYADVKQNSDDSEVYYIAEDKFWYANMEFAVAAFRGWFETAKASAIAPHHYSILEAEGVSTGIEYLEQKDGCVKIIFDLQGHRLNEVQSGNINNVNGKNIIVK